MPETTDYYQKYMSDIVGTMQPSLRTQKKGMYDFLLSNSLRTGQSAQAVAEGMRPYAQAAGDAAAKAGITATKMAQQQEQFDVQQANWEKSFDQGQANWEKAMEVQRSQQNTANMISMFKSTGWTQELLDAMGYDEGSAGGTQFNRMLDDLGFSQPEGVGDDSGGFQPGFVPGIGNDFGYWDRYKA
jgi:hypothetical protein